MNAGRSAPAISAASAATSPASGATPDADARVDRGHVACRRPEHVEREVEERRSAVRLIARRAASCTIAPACWGVLHRRGRLRDRCQDRDVVELLQRSRAPATLRRPTAEHDHGRPVEVRRRDRRDPVGDAGPGGERGEAGPPGQLRVRLGGERGRLLVAGVDHAHPLVAGRVVERPDVATVEREHHVGAERRQRGDRLLAGVSFDQCHVNRP